jgi:hypothetical protein
MMLGGMMLDGMMLGGMMLDGMMLGGILGDTPGFLSGGMRP